MLERKSKEVARNLAQLLDSVHPRRIRGIAKDLDISSQAVYGWCKRGQIPENQLGYMKTKAPEILESWNEILIAGAPSKSVNFAE